MIAIVDYKAGNLTSVAAAFASLGEAAVVTADAAEIAAAERIVFPGVGAAGAAMKHLHDLRLADPLREALAAGKPFLGICLGYQVLFEHSDEDGGVACLGILPGRVVRFAPEMRDKAQEPPLKIPQMGWNQAHPERAHPLLQGLPDNAEFYFVHSYYPMPAPADVLTRTTYGVPFASGVARNNLAAFQFHPEKSGRPGLKLLHNFCRWDGR